jgi:hypothetical protein
VDPYEYIVNLSKNFITLINRKVAAVWREEKFEATIRKHRDDCFAGREIHFIDQFKTTSTATR